MKFCPYCNSKIEDNAVFCIVCGRQIDAIPDYGNPPRRKRVGKGVVLGVIICVLLIVIAVMATVMIMNHNQHTNDDRLVGYIPEISTTVPTEIPTKAPEVTPQVIIITPTPVKNPPAAGINYGDALRVVNCNEWVSLRKTPSKSAERLNAIPLGDMVMFVEKASNGFYYVEYNGTRGYVLQEYLTR